MYKNCFVAFIDIMGFSKFVKSGTSDEVYKLLSAFVRRPNETISVSPINTRISVFSDSVIISVPIETTDKYAVRDLFSNFLNYINVLQWIYLTHTDFEPLPVRGGIAKGNFFTDEKTMLFGEALVHAYETESKLACYPRIVVSADIDYNELEEVNTRQQILRKDFDGLLHCNYLRTLLNFDINKQSVYICNVLKNHRNYIVKNLHGSMDNPVLYGKYHWIKTYHNWFCEGYDMFSEYLI